MLKQVVVVEGRNDTAAVQRALAADTIETGGSAVSAATLRQIGLAQERRGVIVFTDPDVQGERIRRLVSEAIPGCLHAFLPREKAMGRGKIGVEHATPEAIRQALFAYRQEWLEEGDSPVDWGEWLSWGMVSGPGAKRRRIRLGEALGIGYGNGKQMYRKVHRYRVTREELERALEVVRQ